MEERNIYHDISERTNGDIYIGVVGPVRTGKSTFIKRFHGHHCHPEHRDANYRRDRAIDELPQSAAGRTIMTTEPKFVPEQAVTVDYRGQRQLCRADDRLRGVHRARAHWDMWKTICPAW